MLRSVGAGYKSLFDGTAHLVTVVRKMGALGPLA